MSLSTSGRVSVFDLPKGVRLPSSVTSLKSIQERHFAKKTSTSSSVTWVCSVNLREQPRRVVSMAHGLDGTAQLFRRLDGVQEHLMLCERRCANWWFSSWWPSLEPTQKEKPPLFWGNRTPEDGCRGSFQLPFKQPNKGCPPKTTHAYTKWVKARPMRFNWETKNVTYGWTSQFL